MKLVPDESHPTIDQDGLQPIGPAAAAMALLLAALWGGTPVAVKFSVVDGLGPIAVSGVRFAMAAVFMLFWCRWEGTGIRLRREQVLPSLILGLLLIVQIATFTIGIDRSSASHGTLFINTFIFWVAAFEHFSARGSRLNRRRVLGMICAASGMMLILWTTKTTDPATAKPDDPDLIGDLILILSGFLLGIKIVYTKHAMKVVESGKLIFWHDVVGVVGFAIAAILFESPDLRPLFSMAIIEVRETREALFGLLYQGVVVAGFCFAAQGILLKRHSASQLSVFSFSTPIFGVTFAVLLRGEVLSGWLAIAGVFVAVGILLVNLRSRSKTD